MRSLKRTSRDASRVRRRRSLERESKLYGMIICARARARATRIIRTTPSKRVSRASSGAIRAEREFPRACVVFVPRDIGTIARITIKKCPRRYIRMTRVISRVTRCCWIYKSVRFNCFFFCSFKARSLARSPVRRKGNSRSAALSGNNGSLLLYVIKVTHK